MDKDLQHHLLPDLVPQIIWTNDEKGNADYFNDRWYNYTGLSFSQSYGEGWEAVAHEDDLGAAAEWRKAFAEKRIFESQVRLRRHDGVYELHLLRNVPLKTADAKVEKWFGTATNFQAIADMYEAYRRKSDFLKSVLDAADEFAIITLDANGHIVDWSYGAEKMFGFSEQEALGKYTDIIFTDEDRAGGIPEKEMQLATETGRSMDERWHLRKDGTRFYMSGVMTPLKNYGGFVKITRNITEKKLTEEALMMAERRNSIAMHAAQVGEWEWNLQTDRVKINKTAAQILALSETEIQLSAEDLLKRVHASDLPDVRAEIKKAVSGLNVIQAEIRVSGNNNGDYRWINFYGRIISHENNVPRFMIGVMYDITERKTLEKQKDEFLSVASHELKTPVTSIKAYAELLKEIFEDNVQHEYGKIVEKLDNQVDRLIRLFNTLLDSTRLTEGRLEIKPEPLDLNEILSDQVDQFRLLAPQHTLTFEPSQIGLVNADKDRITQVVTNILSNAVKYSPPGSEIFISSTDDLDGVLVKVRDSGPGIALEDQRKIFNQYYRGTDQMSSQSGFGLGLYICAEIIRQHHGLIGVESIPGQGSTFYFKLLYT